jgi:hypothetical protein
MCDYLNLDHHLHLSYRVPQVLPCKPHYRSRGWTSDARHKSNRNIVLYISPPKGRFEGSSKVVDPLNDIVLQK